MRSRRRRSDQVFGRAEDRFDAIIGYNGWVADEGEDGRLGFYLSFKNGHGVTKAKPILDRIGAVVRQESVNELAGSVPESNIETACNLIKAFRRGSGNPQPNQSGLRSRS